MVNRYIKYQILAPTDKIVYEAYAQQAYQLFNLESQGKINWVKKKGVRIALESMSFNQVWSNQ